MFSVYKHRWGPHLWHLRVAADQSHALQSTVSAPHVTETSLSSTWLEYGILRFISLLLVNCCIQAANVDINAAAGTIKAGAVGAAAADDMQIDSSSKGTKNDVGASTEGGSEAEAGAGAADATASTRGEEGAAVTEVSLFCGGVRWQVMVQ